VDAGRHKNFGVVLGELLRPDRHSVSDADGMRPHGLQALGAGSTPGVIRHAGIWADRAFWGGRYLMIGGERIRNGDQGG